MDVTTTTDANLIGATDNQQLSFALRENRVIFTKDQDFLRHHQAGSEHAGIVYSRQGARSIVEHAGLADHDLVAAEESPGEST
jgi:predicted nuclease of predicted toxin-antitoxin system